MTPVKPKAPPALTAEFVTEKPTAEPEMLLSLPKQRSSQFTVLEPLHIHAEKQSKHWHTPGTQPPPVEVAPTEDPVTATENPLVVTTLVAAWLVTLAGEPPKPSPPIPPGPTPTPSTCPGPR